MTNITKIIDNPEEKAPHNALNTFCRKGGYEGKEELFKVIDQDNNMHEYIVYTDGSIKGFPGHPLVFNRFHRIRKLREEAEALEKTTTK